MKYSAILAAFSFATFLTINTNAITLEKLGRIDFQKGNYESFLLFASKQEKPIMILFYHENSSEALNLRQTLHNSNLVNYINAHFLSFLINIEEENGKVFPLTQKYKINKELALVFLSPLGKILLKTPVPSHYSNFHEVVSAVINPTKKSGNHVESAQLKINHKPKNELIHKKPSLLKVATLGQDFEFNSNLKSAFKYRVSRSSAILPADNRTIRGKSFKNNKLS